MRFAASSRVQRASLIAALSLGVLSVTGCSYITPQATTMTYSPSDGVRTDVGNIEVRNLIVVSNGKGQPGRVIGALFNTSGQDIRVTISGDNGSQTEINVPANAPVYLNQETDSAILSTVKGAPGTVEDLTISQNGTKTPDSTKLQVPVMDASLKEYKQYIPTPSPSSTSTASSSASDSASTSSASATATASK
ncbi:MAG: hypothetical protein HIU81_07585 [Acidobacteria bacterium]|nr:hypothetical protein [Acidobacteriota bacterium]